VVTWILRFSSRWWFNPHPFGHCSNNDHIESCKRPSCTIIDMKKEYIILISVVVLLIVIRIILPYVVLHYANKTLTEMNGYYGHIDDIDLSLYRGGYIIHNIYLNKVDSTSKKQTEFFKSRNKNIFVCPKE
jgi:hypothetical protein